LQARSDELGESMETVNASRSPAEDFREAARDLVPLLREQAELTESLNRISPVVMNALINRGLLFPPHLIADQRIEESLLPLLEVSHILGTGCLSTAWLAAHFLYNFSMLAMWPMVVRNAILMDGADVLISSSLDHASGTAVRSRDGSGYYFSGTWEIVCGVDEASYVMLGAQSQSLRDESSHVVIGILPKTSPEISNAVSTLGLCGAGNRKLVCRNVLIADEWVIDTGKLEDDAPSKMPSSIGSKFSLPFNGLLSHLTAAAMLGNAQGIYDEFVTGARLRYTTDSRLPAEQFVAQQIRVAEAQALIVNGTLLIRRDANEATALSKRSEVASEQVRWIWRMHAAYAARAATRAVHLLFSAYGGGGNFKANNAQRRFRDTYSTVGYDLLGWEIPAAEFGRIALTACGTTNQPGRV
jgi:hypothetical protein